MPLDDQKNLLEFCKLLEGIDLEKIKNYLIGREENEESPKLAPVFRELS